MEKEQSLKTLTMVVYALQAAGFFVGITWIVAVVINYVKKQEVKGTWLESHFRWQIRTFWFALLWLVVGAILVVTVIGIPLAWILVALVGLWVLYRMTRGLARLMNQQAMPVD